jgi:TFIIH basal transcription factor complex TTD-A subunit
MKAVKGLYKNFPTKQLLCTIADPLALGVLFIWSVQSTTSGIPGTPESWLLDSDPAVKQILLTMNERQTFIIEDLDDYHLVIKGDEEYRVRQELEAEVCPLCLYVPVCFTLTPYSS